MKHAFKTLKKMARQRRGIPRSLGNKPTKIHTFRQTVLRGSIDNSGVIEKCLGYQFTLNDLPQAATLAALFDQYRIDRVTMKFYPRATPVIDLGSAVPYPQGYWLSCIDYDDANTPANLDELRQYESCKVHPTGQGKVITVTVKPHIAMAAYGGAAFTSYANASKQWLDVASLTIPHYGVKVGFAPSGSAGLITQVYDIQVLYDISFKNVR